jgi:prevent-host-death family protein
MAFSSDDIVPLSQARARLTELAEEARAGGEKIITKNGESYVALIDARRLDHYHRLEQEHIHLTLLAEAAKGLDDVREGRTKSVAELRKKYRR